MLLLLLQALTLHTSLKIPSVFYYSSTRMILAAITTLFFIICTGSRYINTVLFLKSGHSIRVEECPMLAKLHQKKKHIPTMGGLLILASLLLALLLWMDLHSSFTLILFVTIIWLGVLGGIDDYLKIKHKNSKGLCVWKKFGSQFLLAILLGLYLLWPPFSELIHHGSWFVPPTSKIAKEMLSMKDMYTYYFIPFSKVALILGGGGSIIGFFITVIVVTGSSNAVNLTDGLDGLAAGSVLLISLVLALVAFLSNHIEMAHYLNLLYIKGSGEIAVFMCAVIGSCLGFLWYNGYPAQVFMGDTGSLTLGGILGTVAILLRREFLLALVGGVFVIEALSVILQVLSYRYRNKKRIFLCAPLHHHFEFKGWSEPKVVLRFWIIGFILVLIGVASIKIQ